MLAHRFNVSNESKQKIQNIKVGDSIQIARPEDTLSDNPVFDAFKVVVVLKDCINIISNDGKTRSRKKSTLAWELDNNLAKI